jgi:hypothetical protein
MPTQYRLVQLGKTASGGCSSRPRFVRAVAPRIIIIYIKTLGRQKSYTCVTLQDYTSHPSVLRACSQ